MYKNFPWIRNREFLITHSCGDFIIIFLISYLADVGYKISTLTGLSWIILSYIIGKYSIHSKKKIIINFYYLIKELVIYLIHFSIFKLFLSLDISGSNIFQVINKYTIFQILFFLIIFNIIFHKHAKNYFLFIGEDENFTLCQNLIKDTNVKTNLFKYSEGVIFKKTNLIGIVTDKPNDNYDIKTNLYLKNLKKEGFIIYSLVDWAGVELQNYPVDFLHDNNSFINQLTTINKPFQYRFKKLQNS